MCFRFVRSRVEIEKFEEYRDEEGKGAWSMSRQERRLQTGTREQQQQSVIDHWLCHAKLLSMLGLQSRLCRYSQLQIYSRYTCRYSCRYTATDALCHRSFACEQKISRKLNLRALLLRRLTHRHTQRYSRLIQSCIIYEYMTKIQQSVQTELLQDGNETKQRSSAVGDINESIRKQIRV